MVSTKRVVGVILAGGKSSRMGGGDKCLLPLGRPTGPRLCHRSLEAAGLRYRYQCQWRPVALCATLACRSSPTAWQALPGRLPVSMRDLSGSRPTVPALVTLLPFASDTPFFPDDLVQRFLSELEHHPSLLVAASAEGVHPVVGLWPVALARDLQECLEQGMHKVGAFTKQHGAVEVFFPPVKVGGRLVDPFFNINRPEELEQAGALLGHQPR